VTEPRWLALVHVLAIHSDQIQAHGGSLGLRERGLLESALERPRNRFHYEPTSDLPSLAASYGFGIAKNHPFVDGNKRVAFQAMYLFLGLNGLRIDAFEEEVVATTLALASGDLDEPSLAAWLRDHVTPR
jgi:death-on-curing protein